MYKIFIPSTPPELGPCTCDLTANLCDLHCCCDTDCTGGSFDWCLPDGPVASGSQVPECIDDRELARFNPSESRGLVTGTRASFLPFFNLRTVFYFTLSFLFFVFSFSFCYISSSSSSSSSSSLPPDSNQPLFFRSNHSTLI